MGLAATCSAVAGLPALAQKSIPVRSLTPAIATDSGVLAAITGVRPLPGGRVLVSDVKQNRIVLFDSTLSKATIVLDNAGGLPAKLGLIRYLGDSTIVADPEANALVVLGPQGNSVRTMAPPIGRDIRNIATAALGNANGQPGFDTRGRLVYRGFRSQHPVAMPSPEADSGKLLMDPAIDSAPILRADLGARRVDTVAMLKTATIRTGILAVGRGAYLGVTLLNPLSSGDDWTLLPDGTIALVRSHDYHIDWLQPDGTLISSPRMPFDWRSITLDDKRRILDSAKQAATERRSSEKVEFPRGPVMTVDPGDLPDYYPPLLRQGQLKADPEGRIWILPSTSALSAAASPSLVFDVINRKGEIVERVSLPSGRNLVGLGEHDFVYMSYVDYTPGHQVARLECARIIR